MRFLIKFYNLLTLTMKEPGNFGWYHIVCILAVAGLTYAVCKLFKDCSDKTLRYISGIVWGVILALEIYKQLTYGFEVDEDRLIWDYSWYIFPFQFCSSPLYILPIIAFAKSERLRECCIAYMMTYSLFAGLAVFCYPNDVFVETIGINIQTMVHHGSQILMGAFYATRYRDRLNRKLFIDGTKVFVVMVLVAMVLNVSFYRILTFFGINETFNMFYISPHFKCTLPLLSTVWEYIPYVLFVFVYFFGFILCALIVYAVIKGVTVAVRRCIGTRSAEA